LHQGVNSLRSNSGLVTLDIHDDVARQLGRHLSNAICTGRVGRRGEHGLATARCHGGHDALVVGSHDDGIDQAGLAGTLIDVLDHGFPGDRY
jgi:hypothetical protein